MCNDRATKKKPPDASREPRGAERIIENGLRQRVLSDDELATIWNALDDGGDYAPLLRLLMLTGARREEIAGLPWSEIDPEAALVRLPGERNKNGRPHDIPLVPQALAILKARQRQEGRDFVFGTNGRGFVDFSGSRADSSANTFADTLREAIRGKAPFKATRQEQGRATENPTS
jgi:integrase